MIQIKFTTDEIEKLNYERYHYPHPKVQKKMEALFLKSQGLPHSQYYLNGAGVATPDPGEAPPMAGFNIRYPWLHKINSYR